MSAAPTRSPSRKAGSGWHCPHCKQPLRIRNSYDKGALVRLYFLQCLEINCGATFTAFMEVVCQNSPSGTPNPQMAPQLDEITRRFRERASRQATAHHKSIKS